MGEQRALRQHSCNLYAAVCLQVQHDAARCNFGAKQFIFDLDGHVDRLHFLDQFSLIR